MALRMPEGEPLVVDGVDVVAEVHAVLRRMGDFAAQVRDGRWVGSTGSRIRNVVNIGIGGSDLGPAMAYDALHAYSHPALQLRFVSNVDGADLVDALAGLDAAETLFVVSSKTFTTLETITNATSARDWLLDRLGGDESAIARHFVAVSTNAEKVDEFGIDPANMFEFWDWVGGRYSMWSAIGLSLMIAIGPDNFAELLAGAHEMDEHFRTAPLAENLPGHDGVARVLVPRLPRRADPRGRAVRAGAREVAVVPPAARDGEQRQVGAARRFAGRRRPPAAIVWGTVGTNGQHAYFQLLHQGTTLVPIDFIGFVRATRPRARTPSGPARRQPARAVGSARVRQDRGGGGRRGRAARPGAAPHVPRQPPVERVVRRSAHAARSGADRRVRAQGADARRVVGIDSFDQWGVELGKVLAGRIVAELEADTEPALAHDSSTNALIRRYRAGRAPPERAGPL